MTVPVLPDEIEERTVRAVLDARATERRDHVALIAPSLVTGAEVQLTYGELQAAAVRLAAALAARGVGKGDRVGIMLENDGAAEAHIAYHASHRLGAINVPVNCRYVRRELRYVLGFVELAALVFAGTFADVLSGLGDVLEDTALLELSAAPRLGENYADAAGAAPTPAPDVPLTEEDDADWIFTSGTTGTPKAVAITHGQSVACGHQAGPPFVLEPDAVYQSFAPFFTSTGCHTNLLGCLVAGCTYVVEPAFDARGTLDRMTRHGTTSVFLINTVLQLIFDRLGEAALTEGEFPALRRICYGAQPGGSELIRRIWAVGQAMGIEVVNIYGLTESGNAGLMLAPEDHPAALERIGPYGMSIGRTAFHPWVEYDVRDAAGRTVAAGELGELWMRGPSRMSRYVRDPEASAAVSREGGWVVTGDTCMIDDAGFVFFVDRSKQLIRRGGLNISSAEVEGVLLEHPGVLEAAAVPLPNPVLGEDVRGVIVATADRPTAEELIAFCRERLADYKVPSRIDFVDSLPRNGMGRVVKGILTGKTHPDV